MVLTTFWGLQPQRDFLHIRNGMLGRTLFSMFFRVRLRTFYPPMRVRTGPFTLQGRQKTTKNTPDDAMVN